MICGRLFVNKKIYANVMKYIDNIHLFSELNIFNDKCKYNFEYICRMDCIISIWKYIKYRKQIKYNNKKIWTNVCILHIVQIIQNILN